jgi:hypothetical protein
LARGSARRPPNQIKRLKSIYGSTIDSGPFGELAVINRQRILLLVSSGVLPLVLMFRFYPSPSRVDQQSNRNAIEAFTNTLLTSAKAPAGSGDFTEEDFAKHVDQLKQRLPSGEFSIIVQRPFVVIGDEPAETVREDSIRTVKWAVDKLKQDYFSKDPKEILDIWLFKDAASYERNALALFGDKPTTPYGYYSSEHRALIMNISTGGGTLVHEIVHPFIEANFPACPAWLNEGLGSLYEQCGEVDGHIHGYTNWRLPGLQAAIKAGKVPSFKTLTALDSRGFYHDDRGTNYGHARYLCYYLQQRKLLTKFYREFHAHQRQDPTGYKSLRKTLGGVDMNQFKRKWEKYVLGLAQGYEVTVAP